MNGNSRRPKATKKKTVKECPNPLFLKWLERWRDEAKAKESKLQYVYNKAISSLKKYPLPLESGKEATILEGVGPGIAKQLDEALEKHKRDLENNVVLDLPDEDIIELDFSNMRVPPPPNMVAASPTINGTPKSSDEPKPKKKRKSSPREYIPVFRSGPYAMMLALLKAGERIGYKGYLTKAELQQQAQPYTETSFTVPEPDSHYTAWSSMSTLIKKGLVAKSGNPARFSLTDAGYALADKLTNASATHNASLVSPSSSQTSPNPYTTAFSPPSSTTCFVPKPRTPTTPRGRGASEPCTPTASPQTISTPSAALQSVNNLPASGNILPYPLSKNPSKDFLASYRFKTSGTEAMPCQLGSLKFWYVGNDGECVDEQDKAAVIIDDAISFGYLIKCRRSELENAKVEYKIDHSRPSKDGHVFAFIASESVARLSEVAESVSTKKKSSVKTQAKSTLSDDDSEDEMLMRPLFERLGGKKTENEIKSNILSSKKAIDGLSADVPDIISISESEVPTISRPRTSMKNVNTKPNLMPEIISITESSQPKILGPSRSCISTGNITKPNILSVTESRSLSAENNVKPTSSKSVTVQVQKLSNDREPSQLKLSALIKPSPDKQASQSDKPSVSSKTVRKIITPEYELKAGSFEIILCVDFIETTGGSKTTRKEEMVKELRMNGVSFDVRKLNVGDFLWVAREKVLPLPGQLVLPERRELVLDYIVERKRMDDLCSSIKDGRFKEQKFRLINSGLKHPVYLVEDFGSMISMSMPAQTLEQAIVNTQVGQEFFVKRTRDIKESAAYLTLMTRYLQTSYENETLKAIKREDMEHVAVEGSQMNTFLMTFQELNDISVKNRVLTVGELYGKQLLQIPGVAAEKVVGIMEHYPTLRDLLEAYEDETTEKAKENMLSNIKFGKTQRKIGPSVSKTVYQLYCTKGALL